MSSFTSPLIVTPIGRKWKLFKEFTYHIGSKYSNNTIHVPAGFVTDFASIPQTLIIVTGLIGMILAYYFNLAWLLWVGVLLILIILTMPAWGRYGKAAVVHDYLYQDVDNKWRDRKYADAVFHEAMLVSGTKRWKAKIMYWAVRLFSWFAWKKR